MSSTTVQTPLPIPARDFPPPQKLSEKERAEYDRVLAHFSNPDYVLPGTDAEKGFLMEEERMWLSYECILRFLRATKYDPSECIKRLEGALKWRRDFGLYSLVTSELVEAEAATGSMFLYGYDFQGRPVVYYYPSKRTTKDDLQQIQFIFWIIERAIELMVPGVETVTFMVDFADEAQHPSFYVTRQTLYIMQTHYPEHIGTIAVIRSPWLLSTFWKLVIPLFDSYTRSKVLFASVSDEDGLWRTAEARDRGEPDAMLATSGQLVSEGFAGSVPFEHEHAVYWPALLAMCEGRKKELSQVWRQLGGVAGIKEWDVKIGVRDGLIAPVSVN